jgi:hypothetical protein
MLMLMLMLMLPPASIPAQRKDSKVRMLTTFGVQASTNAFSTAQRLFKDGPGRVLPKVSACVAACNHDQQQRTQPRQHAREACSVRP